MDYMCPPSPSANYWRQNKSGYQMDVIKVMVPWVAYKYTCGKNRRKKCGYPYTSKDIVLDINPTFYLSIMRVKMTVSFTDTVLPTFLISGVAAIVAHVVWPRLSWSRAVLTQLSSHSVAWVIINPGTLATTWVIIISNFLHTYIQETSSE